MDEDVSIVQEIAPKPLRGFTRGNRGSTRGPTRGGPNASSGRGANRGVGSPGTVAQAFAAHQAHRERLAARTAPLGRRPEGTWHPPAVHNLREVVVDVETEEQERTALAELRDMTRKRPASGSSAGESAAKKPNIAALAERVVRQRTANAEKAIPKICATDEAAQAVAEMRRQNGKTQETFQVLLYLIQDKYNQDVQVENALEKLRAEQSQLWADFVANNAKMCEVTQKIELESRKVAGMQPIPAKSENVETQKVTPMEIGESSNTVTLTSNIGAVVAKEKETPRKEAKKAEQENPKVTLRIENETKSSSKKEDKSRSSSSRREDRKTSSSRREGSRRSASPQRGRSVSSKRDEKKSPKEEKKELKKTPPREEDSDSDSWTPVKSRRSRRGSTKTPLKESYLLKTKSSVDSPRAPSYPESHSDASSTASAVERMQKLEVQRKLEIRLPRLNVPASMTPVSSPTVERRVVDKEPPKEKVTPMEVETEEPAEQKEKVSSSDAASTSGIMNKIDEVLEDKETGVWTAEECEVFRKANKEADAVSLASSIADGAVSTEPFFTNPQSNTAEISSAVKAPSSKPGALGTVPEESESSAEKESAESLAGDPVSQSKRLEQEVD